VRGTDSTLEPGCVPRSGSCPHARPRSLNRPHPSCPPRLSLAGPSVGLVAFFSAQQWAKSGADRSTSCPFVHLATGCALAPRVHMFRHELSSEFLPRREHRAALARRAHPAPTDPRPETVSDRDPAARGPQPGSAAANPSVLRHRSPFLNSSHVFAPGGARVRSTRFV